MDYFCWHPQNCLFVNISGTKISKTALFSQGMDYGQPLLSCLSEWGDYKIWLYSNCACFHFL